MSQSAELTHTEFKLNIYYNQTGANIYKYYPTGQT